MRYLGVSKVCITPQRPVRLCGFGFRTSPYEAVRDDIYVRVLDLKEDERHIVFIYGDLLWWNTAFVSQMRHVIEEQLGICGDNLLFVASHNHSGPGTGNTFVSLLETADEEYVSFLQGQIIKALRLAQEDSEPVRITCSEGQCSLNVYRRVMTEDGIRMMPNYEVEPDRTLTVYHFYRSDNTLKSRVMHYPCHANLSKDNELHPDYPGYALDLLDKRDPGSISIFLQGCTADLRPNCVLGDEFRAAGNGEVEAFAERFCLAVEHAVQHETPVGEGLDYKKLEIRLPVRQTLSRQEIEERLTDEAEEIRQWAGQVLQKNLRNYEILEMSAVKIGEQLLCFFNAEVSMYYAQAMRERVSGTVCAGYTNGMIGYLSTADLIREGGYEHRDSAIWIAVAGKYDEAIEQIIYDAMEEVEAWKKDV